MAKEVDFTDPKSVVTSFIAQLNLWEKLAASFSAAGEARFRGEDDSTLDSEEGKIGEVINQIPALVVSIYLTPRKRAYVPSISYSTPPEYDPRLEKVTNVIEKSKSEVIVQTDRKSAYMGGTREYVMKKKDGKWLIDSCSVTLGGKKMKATLV